MPPDAIGLIVPGFFFTAIVTIISVAVVKAAKAFASRGSSSAELGQLRREIEDLHGAVEQQSTQLAELHERLDFAERLLAKGTESRGAEIR
jgi:predicted  nucleic acid-binding Zn-ribbon protein